MPETLGNTRERVSCTVQGISSQEIWRNWVAAGQRGGDVAHGSPPKSTPTLMVPARFIEWRHVLPVAHLRRSCGGSNRAFACSGVDVMAPGYHHPAARVLEPVRTPDRLLDHSAVPGLRDRRRTVLLRHSRSRRHLLVCRRSGIASMHLASSPHQCAPQANAYCERLIGTMRRECFIG